MTEKQHSEKNTGLSGPIWNVLGSGMMAGNTVLLSMLVGHFFDLNEVGMFSLAQTTSQVLYALALFGANDLQMTDYHHRHKFREYFWIKVFSTVLAVLACFVTIFGLKLGRKESLYTLLLTAFMLVNSIGEMYQAMYFQCGRLDLSGKSLFYRYFLSTVSFIVVLVIWRSMIGACAVMLAVDVVLTIWWTLRYSEKFRDSGYEYDREKSQKLLLKALPLCLSVIGSLLIINAPKYLINAYLSDEIQGAYSILFMPTYAINLLGQFVFKPFFPRYAEAVKDDGKAFRHLFVMHAGATALFALSGGIGMWLLGVPVLKLLFGQDLSGYRLMMFLFVLSGGLLAVNQLLYYIMVIMGKQKVILRLYLLGIAVTLIFGFAAVPRLSIGGAWISFTAGQLCLTVGYLAVLIRAFVKK